MSDDSLVITLTGRPPVKIRKQDWPVVASARDWEGEHEFQSFRKWRLYVRRHADGRTIVYGVHETAWRGEHDRRAGELLDASQDVCAAILRVGERVGCDQAVIDACIADLPAVEI